jgi:2-phosphosulfolactate phosphatase
MPKIDIVFAAREQLDARQAQVVVIDVFRATSTMVTALHNGCREIIPVASLSEALTLAARSKEVLLAGERNTQKPAHFDLGNSPREFTPQRVGGKRIVLTTTNGTRALRGIHNARGTLLASFLNIQAVASYLEQLSHDVLFYCAGNDGQFSLEDTLCASWLISELCAKTSDWQCSDAAHWSLRALGDSGSKDQKETILQWAAQSAHARRLAANSLQEDVAFCLQWAAFEDVPVLDLQGRVVLAK